MGQTLQEINFADRAIFGLAAVGTTLASPLAGGYHTIVGGALTTYSVILRDNVKAGEEKTKAGISLRKAADWWIAPTEFAMGCVKPVVTDNRERNYQGKGWLTTFATERIFGYAQLEHGPALPLGKKLRIIQRCAFGVGGVVAIATRVLDWFLGVGAGVIVLFASPWGKRDGVKKIYRFAINSLAIAGVLEDLATGMQGIRRPVSLHYDETRGLRFVNDLMDQREETRHTKSKPKPIDVGEPPAGL